SRRAADRADGGELVGFGVLRTLLEHDLDDLRNDVTGALDHHGIADADIHAVADGLAEAVAAGDVVLVVQRDVFDRDPAHGDRVEPANGRERAGAAYLDVDLPQHRRRLFGGEFVGYGPARLAGDVAPALLQVETVELVDDA